MFVTLFWLLINAHEPHRLPSFSVVFQYIHAPCSDLTQSFLLSLNTSHKYSTCRSSVCGRGRVWWEGYEWERCMNIWGMVMWCADGGEHPVSALSLFTLFHCVRISHWIWSLSGKQQFPGRPLHRVAGFLKVMATFKCVQGTELQFPCLCN